MKLNKSLIFVMTLMVLIIGISAVSAADIDNNNTDVSSAVSVSSVSSQASDVSDVASVEKETKTVKSEAKSIKKEDKTVNTVKKESSVKTTKTTQKSLKTEADIDVNDSNFDDYFTSTGFTEKVSDGASITFSSDVSRNGTSYVVNKPVNINGNNYTLTLNTTSGSYLGNETGSAFIIDNGAAGTNLTNLNFYNTQVFVRNTTNVVVDHINSTVKDQRIGSGVGTFSVREGAVNVTVKNSFFHTENNGGSSSLVLAGVYNCTFDNNTVEGVGTVGHLIYLTTYNVEGIDVTNMTVNSYNKITNNRVYGPSQKSGICSGIVLSGNNNLIQNNSVYYTGVGMSAQWMSTSTTNISEGADNQRYIGNDYYDNKLYNGSSFTSTSNGTIKGNYFSGNVNTGTNSTLRDNTILGDLTISNNATVKNNLVQGTATVTGSNVVIENNTIHGLVTVNSAVKNATIQNNNFCNNVTSSNKVIYNMNNSCTGTCNCGVASCSCSACSSTSTVKSLKKDDETTVVYVTSENINTYIRDDGADYVNTVECYGKTLVFDSTVPSALKKHKTIYFNFPGDSSKAIHITGANNNVTFYNHYFYLQANSPLKISNMTFAYDESQLFPSNDKSLSDGIIDVIASTTLENVTIKANISEFTDDIPEGSYIIGSWSGNVATFKNCTFDFTIPTANINFDPSSYTGQPRLVPIVAEAGTFDFINNTVIMKEGTSTDLYATMEPFLFKTSGNNVINNTIYMSGEKYLYGMYFAGSSNNVISGNNITVVGSKYTNGIYLSGTSFSNNIITDNYINLTSGNNAGGDVSGNAAEDSGYGINMENMGQGGNIVNPDAITIWNLTVANNTIVMSGYNPYAIELFGAIGNSVVSDNNINVTGHVPSAITMMGYNTTIEGNNINIVGESNETEDSADWFRPTTTGIYLKQGLNNTVKNNSISVVNGTGVKYDTSERNTTVANNKIIVDNEITVYVDDSSTGAVIENNTLVATSLTGDDSVSADRTNNIVRNNTDITAIDTSLVVDVDETADVFVGDDVAINLTLTDVDGNPISGNVVLTIGNFITDVAIDSTGRATYTYTTTGSGSLTISAKYEGEGDYLASESNIADVEVSKITPEITVEVADNNIAIVTRDTVINGTLVDSEGNAISGATINVYVNNVLIGTNTTDSEGKYTYTYVPATVGENIPVNVTFAGDDKYYAAVQTSWVDVEKIGTVLTVDSIDNTIINNTVVVTGSLTEEYTGTVVSDATIKVTVGNAVYTNTTDSEGKYTIIVDGQAVAGTYDVSVSYDGSTVYDESSDETAYDVEVLGTTTTVEPVDVTLNETATLTATVIDENNANVNGGNVTFTINGTVIGTADVIDGVATMNVTALKAWNNTNISASYSGMVDVYQDSLSENSTVNVALRDATLTLITDKLSGKKGDTITFIAQITDGDTLVNQGYVSFKLNGVTLIDARTGERNHIKVVNGIAQFEYTLPSYSGKDYNITVVYGGSDYNRAEDTGVLTVVKTNTHMEGNIINISPNGTATLNVKVFDEANDLLDRNVKVSIKVNGITMLKEVTVVNGSSNFDLSLLPSSKTYNITIITGENNNYMGSNTTVLYTNSLPKINTNITATTSTTGDVTAVNVNVKDVYGNAVSANPKVSIKVDGKTVISSQTAVNGVYTGNITTPTSGSHKLLVIAGETDSYASSKSETTFTI